MPLLFDGVRGGGRWLGGIVGYPLDQLQEEVAFLAYYFHWPLEHILELEHEDRRRWVEQISGINRRLRDESEGVSSAPEWTGF